MGKQGAKWYKSRHGSENGFVNKAKAIWINNSKKKQFERAFQFLVKGAG